MFSGFHRNTCTSFFTTSYETPFILLSETNADAFLPEINKLVYNPSGALLLQIVFNSAAH
jgi:hypothetical protein